MARHSATLNRRPAEAACHSVQTRHSTARLSLDPLLDRWLVRPRRAVSRVAAYVRMLRGLDGHRVLPFAARHSSIGGRVCATLIDQRSRVSLGGDAAPLPWRDTRRLDRVHLGSCARPQRPACHWRRDTRRSGGVCDWCRGDTQGAFVTLIRCSIGALAMARHSATRSVRDSTAR